MFKVLLTILRVELCLLISKTNSSSIRGVKHGEVVGIGTCGREGWDRSKSTNKTTKGPTFEWLVETEG